MHSMKSVSINIDDKKLDDLQKKADQLGLSIQQLLDATVDDLLSKPDEELENAMRYILKKNSQLYKRLS
jgi:antitoxin component of RelBE/YafQ-DinJ toxin-antitoxin module